MAGLSITELKKGTIFMYEGLPQQVLDYSQKVVGRGGSIVNVRIKSLLDGRVLEKTFKGNELLDRADLAYKNVQYLYNDGAKWYFMDGDTYEQFELTKESIGDQAGFLKEGDTVKVMLLDGTAVSMELPKNVWLEVTYSEDVVRGDTSSALTKPATLETGIETRVPAFIKVGDVVSVSTEDGSYRERKK